MHSSRYKSGHGTGDTALRARFERREARLRAEKKSALVRGASPSPDTRMGGRVAHVGMQGAPTIYEEKAGGRRGGRGKRV